MKTTRRTVLGLAGGSIAAGLTLNSSSADHAPSKAHPSAWTTSPKDHSFGDVLNQVAAYATRELIEIGFPGMTLCLVDDKGFAATLSLGYADVEDQEAVRSDHLFAIGSISKSITGLAVHALAAKGRIDLDSPISKYLPSLPLPATPITPRQLLNHTSGLTANAPLFPLNPDKRLWLSSDPGTQWAYSNIGYGLLGLLIGAVTGKRHPVAIEELVLKPLAMSNARPHLVSADREHYATGYIPKGNVRASLLRAPIMPAPFIDYDLADGAIGASAQAMIGYLRYVIRLGRGLGAPLMPDTQARELLARDAVSEGSDRYASGFDKLDIDGRSILHHTGGTPQFGSAFHVDPEAGIACFASVNANLAGFRPRHTTLYAIQLLRAARSKLRFPVPPVPSVYRAIAQPQKLAGRYLSARGEVIEFKDTGGGLKLVARNVSGRIEQAGGNTILTDHPRYARYSLQHESEADQVVRLWWGNTLFARNQAPALIPTQKSLEPFVGVYTDLTPWTRVEIFERAGNLHVERDGPITSRPEGHWAPQNDRTGRNRLWFDHIVNGKYYNLSLNGSILSRVD